MSKDNQYLSTLTGIFDRIETEQEQNLLDAAGEMATSISDDRLIYLFGGGGHTCLVMQELFWRAGGLANICPMIDFSIHPVTQAYLYLGHERMHGVGDHVVRYYGVEEGDLVLCFHSYGFNPPTIDLALEAKELGATVVGISSSFWQEAVPSDFPLRHRSGKHLFDIADICIDNYVPFGDTVVEFAKFPKPVSSISGSVDFYIAHRLEMEAIRLSAERGVEPPVWTSANVVGGDEENKRLRDRYNSRVKFL